jgi:hypothetical protein
VASLEDVQTLADHFEISTEDLFDRAYFECRGFLESDAGPQTQHEHWKDGGSVPDFVLAFLKTRGVQLIH